MDVGKNFLLQGRYQIKVQGALDPKWQSWFDGFVIHSLPNDQTLLTGEVVDQAALHGLLAKIRDLCLPIISVERLDEEELEQH